MTRYERVRAELDRLEEIEPRDEYASAPFAPASAADIAAWERAIRRPLPPSYRNFLELHDGWKCFWGALWIAGTKGEARRYVDARLAEWKRDVGPMGSADDDEDEVFDPAAHVVIGADDNGGFLALGPTARRDGECDILDIPRGFVENRWPSFDAFVAAQLEHRSRDLERRAARAAAPKKKPPRKRRPKRAPKK